MTPSRYWSGIVVKKKKKQNDASIFLHRVQHSQLMGLLELGLPCTSPYSYTKLEGNPKKKKKTFIAI
jgi:hypothetical protein